MSIFGTTTGVAATAEFRVKTQAPPPGLPDLSLRHIDQFSRLTMQQFGKLGFSHVSVMQRMSTFLEFSNTFNSINVLQTL